MRLVLDTNGYTKLFRKPGELTNLVETADLVFLPAVAVGELYAGFQLGSKFDKNVAEFNEFLKLTGVRIVDVDRDTAERYGILVRSLKTNGTPIPTNDIWIAAATLELGARLVSYDEHFQYVPGLIVLAP